MQWPTFQLKGADIFVERASKMMRSVKLLKLRLSTAVDTKGKYREFLGRG